MISTGREDRVKELCSTSDQNGVHICRLCGQCKCDVISIFSEEAHEKHVLLKIQTRLLIQISASDPLPKNACANCLEKLDSLWEFYELCRKTQIKLRETFLRQHRDERVTLRKKAIDHQGIIGISHPPRCSSNSITHQKTRDTSASASGNKKIKLEHVPFIKEELVCLDENSHTVSASIITSSAGSQESYWNDNREISVESSKNSNIGVGLNHQQESDTAVNKLCISEKVDVIDRRNMLVLQDCDISEGRGTVSLSVQNNDHWKAMSLGLNENSLEQQGILQNVLETKPIIDKQASLDCVNNSAVQNQYRKISAESSSNSNISVRLDHQQESDTTVKKLCLDESLRRNMSILQDCDIGEGIDGRGSVSLNMKMKATSSDLIDDSLEQQGKLRDVLQTKPVVDKQTSLDCINGSVVQENKSRSSCVISISDSESRDNVLLDKTDSWLSSTRTEEGRYSPVRSLESDSEIRRGVSLIDTQQVEERSSLPCRKMEEALLLSVCVDDRVSHQQINKNSSRRSSSESINEARVLSVGTGANHFQVDKVENVNLRSLLCDRKNFEKEERASLLKKDTNTRVRKSLSLEGIKYSLLEEKEKFSASSNTVSDCDTVNKLSSCEVSVHGTNICDKVLQKPEKNSRSLLAQGKSTNDAQASNSDGPSVDDDDCVVIHNSTSSNPTHAKPIETELRPTTIDEARLMCAKYSERICETSGKNPKINMINIKVELPSENFYTGINVINKRFFKPFIILNDSQYDCQICKTTLNNRRTIVKHIGKHFNLFPFCCKFCDRRFTLQGCANGHMKNHCTSLICEQCGAVCVSYAGYLRHVKKHVKPFSCHDCGERFSSKGGVRRHILKEHLKIRSYACKICGKAYFHESNVSTHMIFAHADRKIVCQYCGKMFFRNNMLKEHINRWHT